MIDYILFAATLDEEELRDDLLAIAPISAHSSAGTPAAYIVLGLSLDSPQALRAPSFLNTSERLFHSLTNIRSARYSLGLRQQMQI